MPSVNLTFFNQFLEDLAEKKHNLGSDTLKIMLTNTAPSATNQVKADITEISAGNGYTAGGATVSVISSAHEAGVYKLKANPVSWTATGPVAAFRHAVLYNDSAPSDDLIGWWDYGAEVELSDTEEFSIAPGTDNVLIQLAAA